MSSPIGGTHESQLGDFHLIKLITVQEILDEQHVQRM